MALGSSLRICISVQESGIHIVVGYISLGDELVAQRIVSGKAGDLGEMEK